MIKKIILPVLILFTVLGLGAFCSKTTTPSPEGVQSKVTIQNNLFSPTTIELPINSTVTWDNLDNTEHQIISDGNLPALESGVLQPNETFVFTFSQSGVYSYHCNIHPEMKGTITIK